MCSLVFAAMSLAACNCNDSRLIDISCHPGNADAGTNSTGRFDRNIVELCNGIDDNCDSKVDEGCTCLIGETMTCGSDVGACKSSTVECQDGVFPGCEPLAGPSEEVCDGVDNDCNGQADEIPEATCWTGPPDAVIQGTPCKTGTRRCENGTWSACAGQVLPEEEDCDGDDNDCNGLVDDQTTLEGNSCGYSGQGACRLGAWKCQSNEYVCGPNANGQNPTYPQNETCDNVDNDCDGSKDEELYRPCSTACGQGVESCSSGNWVGCTAALPKTEVCDAIGMDEDCDGQVNEGCACIFGTIQFCRAGIVDSQGNPKTCGRGTQECSLQGTWGQCVFFGTTTEVCDNWDNDCDGSADAFSKSCGDPTTAGVGQCTLGTQTCTGGIWDVCVGAVSPQSEICDNKDNDCDGLIDENLTPHNKVDMVFAVDISGSMCPYSQALAQAIAQYASDFATSQHQFALVVFPARTGSGPYSVEVNLTTIGSFQAAVNNLATANGCNGGGWEPSYDTTEALGTWDAGMTPPNPVGITWRSDAYPYVVVITDEDAQTFRGTWPADIAAAKAAAAAKMSPCTLPGCQAGDKVEIYVVTKLYYQSYWDTVVYNETAKRILEIEPPDKDRYIGLLRNVFTNVCLPP